MSGNRRINILGQRFGMWTVISEVGNIGKSIFWECRCDCGKTGVINGCNLRRGSSQSCGCNKEELRLEKRITHGDTRGKKSTKEFRAWQAIINRCLKPNSTKFYHYYGGRGIGVCERWAASYEFFLEDMGRAPSLKHSIDRIENDKGYCPENCRWATIKEQASNKRSNVRIEYKGVVKIIADWAAELKVPHSAISKRLRNGQSFDRIYQYLKSDLYKQNKIKHGRKHFNES